MSGAKNVRVWHPIWRLTAASVDVAALDTRKTVALRRCELFYPFGLGRRLCSPTIDGDEQRWTLAFDLVLPVNDARQLWGRRLATLFSARAAGVLVVDGADVDFEIRFVPWSQAIISALLALPALLAGVWSGLLISDVPSDTVTVRVARILGALGGAVGAGGLFAAILPRLNKRDSTLGPPWRLTNVAFLVCALIVAIWPVTARMVRVGNGDSTAATWVSGASVPSLGWITVLESDTRDASARGWRSRTDADFCGHELADPLDWGPLSISALLRSGRRVETRLPRACTDDESCITSDDDHECVVSECVGEGAVGETTQYELSCDPCGLSTSDPDVTYHLEIGGTGSRVLDCEHAQRTIVNVAPSVGALTWRRAESAPCEAATNSASAGLWGIDVRADAAPRTFFVPFAAHGFWVSASTRLDMGIEAALHVVGASPGEGVAITMLDASAITSISGSCGGALRFEYRRCPVSTADSAYWAMPQCSGRVEIAVEVDSDASGASLRLPAVSGVLHFPDGTLTGCPSGALIHRYQTFRTLGLTSGPVRWAGTRISEHLWLCEGLSAAEMDDHWPAHIDDETHQVTRGQCCATTRTYECCPRGCAGHAYPAQPFPGCHHDYVQCDRCL
jgi:hypothetical protein